MRSFVVITLLLLVTPSFAGWQKIAQLDTKATCCFFFDDMTGLAGSGEYGTPDIIKIWRTNDGGFTWLPCTVPAAAGQVTAIHMKNTLIGYASIYAPADPQYSLWKTSDGGYSWFDDSRGNTGYTTNVWVTNKAITKTQWENSGGSSINDGSSFSSTFSEGVSKNSNGIYFTSDDIGVVTSGPSTLMSWYTTNGGISWSKGGAQAETWSAWGFKGSNIFFAVAELQKQLVWSTNGGRTWTIRYRFEPLLSNVEMVTGHISGKGSVMYVQTFSAGLLRTGANDSGRTWRFVGGPSNGLDTRAFYVGGCSGELVIAFDKDGSVWKTTDGGDGKLSRADPIVLQHLVFPTIPACSTTAHFGTVAFGDCGEFIIKSVTLENDPTGVFSLKTVPLPDTLTAGGIDTFFVDFDPRGNPATYPARIRIKGEIHRLGSIIPIDSILLISASATAVLPKLASSLNAISFPDLSVCEPGRDTVITLKNLGCDTLTITSGPSPAPPFTIQSLPLPLILPPDSVVSVNISYAPIAGGSFNNSTRILATSQGKQQEIEILLDGKARFGEGVLSIPKPSFIFKTISICATDSLKGYITNTGCDTLIVDSATSVSDPDFSISLASLVKGVKLRPGDTIWFVIGLKPVQKGVRSGIYSVFFHNEHGTFPQSIGQLTFSANVLDGTRTVSQSLDAIDFGTTDLCTERDSFFTLRNTGCDSITITGMLQGSGFELQGVSWPLVLAPGESKDIRVLTKIDTTGGSTQSVAIVTFTGNTSNAIIPIQLKRGYVFSRQYGVRIAMDQTEGTSGSIVRLAIIGEQGLGTAGTGVHTLEATLSINEDLLHYISAEGPNTVTRNGSKIAITHPQELQVTASNSLADLVYKVHLTKDSSTDISLSDLKLNGGDSSPCAPRILGGGPLGNGEPAFSYTYRCGDRTIRKFLETGIPPLDIVSIHPNPASEEVTIEIASQSKEIVKVEIYNDAGDIVARYDRTVASITLPIANLVEGSYTVRLDQSGDIAIARFVVVK
jgi:hypothetical protein